MIDTIKVRSILGEDIPNPEEVLNHLKRIIENAKTEIRLNEYGVKEESTTGNIKNFLIRITRTYITIEGSLPKFHNGNNITTLQPFEIKEALRKLSTLLRFRVERGQLLRVDIADNLHVNESIQLMVSHMSFKRQTPTIRYKTSLTVKRTRLEIQLYDKLEEARKKGYKENCEAFKKAHPGVNLLRLELRLTKQLPHQFGKHLIRTVMLYSKSFLQNLATRWLEVSNGMQFFEGEYSTERISGLADFKRFLIMQGIATYGSSENIMASVNKLSEINGWNKYVKSSVKQFIRKSLTELPETQVDSMQSKYEEALRNTSIVREYGLGK